MNSKEFENVCRAVSHGEEKFVENAKWLYSGRVVACTGDAFEVDAFHHRHRWSRKECREGGETDPLGPPSSRSSAGWTA